MSALASAEARHRFSAARVAHLGTADGQGRPHVVPFVFAVEGDRIYSAVDHKPKRSKDLRRIADIRENPSVCLLVDHYDDDWTALWWARAQGPAQVFGPGSEQARHAVALLSAKYPQYAEQPPRENVIVVEVTTWTGWVAAQPS